jgi:hypothetical protein
MRKVLVLMAVFCLALTTAALADSVAADFESGTPAADLGANWSPDFSGSSSGYDALQPFFHEYSNEQANGGTLSAKEGWTWSGASGGVIRVQPINIIPQANADHSAEPYVHLAIYGTASFATFQLYMTDTGYESFTDTVTIDFLGWQVKQWNILTSPVVAWITGDGILTATACRIRGFFFLQAAETGTQVYYLDDFAYTAASEIEDWSVY